MRKFCKISFISYILVTEISKDVKAKVGSLGIVEFKKGYYMYVGSAKNGMSRVCRHFKKEKKLRWHIDYLTTLKEARVLYAYLFTQEECKLADILLNSHEYRYIPNFGCSDCNCKSHLFYSLTPPDSELSNSVSNMSDVTNIFKQNVVKQIFPDDCIKHKS